MTFEPTPQQQDIIQTLSGDVFVSAGAGSGKTRVLAERFVRAVLQMPDTRCDTLLAITYTDKAAGELAERIRRVFLEHGATAESRQVGTAWLSTIHSFCARILRRHALEAGIDPLFAVADEVEASMLRQEAFEAAAREAMTTSAEVERLVLDYGAAAVRSAASRVLDDIRAMGRTLDDVTAPSPADAVKAAREAAVTLESAAAATVAAGTCDSDDRNATLLTDAAALLVERSPRLDEPAEAERLLSDLGAWRVSGGGRGEERKQARQDANDAVERLRDVLATVAAVPCLEAFLSLLAAYAGRYESAKRSRGLLDFEDLQLRTAELLERDAGVATQYRDAFRLLMVDEFQDTNALQTRIVDAIRADDLCTVGDDNQSIYGFRYADVEVFRRREAELAAQDIEPKTLTRNFRSAKGVLDFVNGAFSAEVFFGPRFRKLTAGRSGDWQLELPDDAPRVEALLVDRAGWEALGWREAEAGHLAARLRRLRDEGVAPASMVVLLRSIGCAETYAEALRREGLPVFVAAGGAYFARPEVAHVRALLRMVANPRDDAATALVLAGPLGGLSDDALWRLRESAGRHGALWDALGELTPDDLGEQDAVRAAHVRGVVSDLRRDQGLLPLADLLMRGCAALGYEHELCGSGPDGERAWANVRKLARLADEFEASAAPDVGAFLEYLERREEHQRHEALAEVSDAEVSAVRILTTHAAKGLEFPVVAVADLGHGRPRGDAAPFVAHPSPEGVVLAARLPRGQDGPGRATPEYRTLQEEARLRGLEEEKRILYVACTRAEELLILSGGTDLGKDAEEEQAISWVREVLGFAAAESAVSGEVAVGEGRVAVTVITAEDGVPGSVAEAGAGEPTPVPGAVPVCALPASRVSEPPSALPPTVSYSSLHQFERCPLRFHAEQLLGLRTVATAASTRATRFGTAVHQALRAADDVPPPPERLDAIAALNELDAEGRAELEAAVEAFLGSPAATRLAAMPSAGREVPFAMRLGAAVLVGEMDVLARDGEGALVVDYKTGAGGEATAHTTQAECYALAAGAAGANTVEVAFVMLQDGGRVETQTFSAEELSCVRTRLGGLVERIASGERGHLPLHDRSVCRGCAGAATICPLGPLGAGF